MLQAVAVIDLTSITATYPGVFGTIRRVYASTHQSRFILGTGRVEKPVPTEYCQCPLPPAAGLMYFAAA